MRVSFLYRSFAIALVAALVVLPAFAHDEHGKDEKGEKKADKKADAKPALFVKDGDNFRPANETELKAAGVSGEPGHGGGGGLEFTGLKRYDLGIYTLIVFGLMMFVLSKYAWPPIKAGLEKREANIRGALDDARKEREEAKVTLSEAKKHLDEAALKAKGIVDDARKDAEALKANEREVGIKDAQAERERARRETAADAEAKEKEIQASVVKLATLIAEKALRRSVTIEDHAKLLDESIAELKSAANKA
jgi:F-type H+-transporting ATPase subunit b